MVVLCVRECGSSSLPVVANRAPDNFSERLVVSSVRGDGQIRYGRY